MVRSDLDAFRAEVRSDLHQALAIQAAVILAAYTAVLITVLMLLMSLAE